MDLSIRDGMLVIGAVMIAVVVLDALRRTYGQRRNEIRLNAKISRTDVPLPDAEEFNLLKELPNGGARIISRDDLVAPAAAEREAAAVAASSNSAPEKDEASRETMGLDDDNLPSFSATDAVEAAPEDLRQPDNISSNDVPKAPSTAPAEIATLDWLEELEVPEPEPELEERLPRATDPHVFVLNVIARDEQGFSGTDILQILLACDLRFGDMDFFHRHEQSAGKGPIQFSVCNMINPGVFDIDNMAEMRTRGLMFFVTLPGPEDMLKAFDYMYETAKAVAKNLNGDVLDDTRSAITRQSLDHMRQQIRELERRLALLDRS